MSTPTQVFVVLETRNYLAGLMEASKHYVEPRTLWVSVTKRTEGTTPRWVVTDVQQRTKPIKPLDISRGWVILRALYQEAISQRLMYKKTESAVEHIARALRDRAVVEKIDIATAEEFLTIPQVDSICMDIGLEIDRIIDNDGWRQWDFYETPSMMAMLGGRDYRINEWERMHYHQEDEGMVLRVDVQNVVNYLTEQLKSHLQSSRIRIDPRALLVVALQRRYPKIHFGWAKHQLHEGEQHEIIHQLYRMYLDDFMARFVDNVFDAFACYYLITHIDSNTDYNLEFPGDGTMVFYAMAKPKNDEERYFHDLRESVSRGDWIPEPERRKLVEWERDHALESHDYA